MSEQKKYLVTGGAGFIGSHIVDALVNNGHDVVVLDDLSSGYKGNLSTRDDPSISIEESRERPSQSDGNGMKCSGNVWKKITFVEGDVRDAETCLKAAEGCDGIFHEAALVSVPDSINRPRDNHDINITGTLNVLEAARANRVKRVVFASSAAIYGDNPELPKQEEMLPEPKTPYAMAKLAGEHYLKVYAECFGLETVALRYFNVFGPRQDPSSMYSGVISIFSERIQKGLPITIYGDGEQTRDFVNVKDVVSANLFAMTRVKIVQDVEVVKRNPNLNEQQSGVSTTSTSPDLSAEALAKVEASGRFNVFNVATGKSTSLLSLLENLEAIVGKTVERNFLPVRAGDIQHSLADVSKVWKTLGYEPKVSLKEGLQGLVEK